jgi:hypothetical protein
MSIRTRWSGRDAAAVLLIGLVLLTGCGGEAEDASSSEQPSATTSSPSASPGGGGTKGVGDDFCAQVKANGGDVLSLGEIATWTAKEQLSTDVTAALDAFQGVTPPDEITDAWTTRLGYLQRLKKAVDALPAGGKLSEPSVVHDPEASKAVGTLTDYWFAHCV